MLMVGALEETAEAFGDVALEGPTQWHDETRGCNAV
jgi:hypothetical protein